MKLVGKCSVSKKKAKKGFEYPIIRFPLGFKNLIGKEAKIYKIDKNKFLILVNENELDNGLDNSIEFVEVDKNLLERAKALGIDIAEFLEEKLREVVENNQLCSGRDLNPGHGIESPV